MGTYILKRLLAMIPTLLGVAVLIFILLRIVPGDVVEARYLAQGSQFVSQDLMNQERAKLGLDKPLWQQFTTWMAGLARLDFGVSMWTGGKISEEIKLRFALSLQLAIMASTIATHTTVSTSAAGSARPARRAPCECRAHAQSTPDARSSRPARRRRRTRD